MQQANKSPALAKAKKTLGPKISLPSESSVIQPAPEKKRGRETLSLHVLGRPSQKSQQEMTSSAAVALEAKKPAKKAQNLRDGRSFQVYIFRVLKESKPETSISKNAMLMINEIIAEIFEKLMRESRELMIHGKKRTLSSKEVETAVKLHFPGELQKLAINASRDALNKVATASAN